MKQYVLVSQGIEIYRTTDKLEAEKIMLEANENFEKYRQKCADNMECCADNEVFLCEEN